MRGKKIMFISKRRFTQIFLVIPILILGLLVAPTGYAEKLNENLAKAIYGPVKGSDTLGRIVSRNYAGSDLSAQQIMAGILRANPDAFIGGNIHYLLKGSTLLLPKEHLIATITDKDAKATIKEHYSYFQDGRTGNFQVIPFEDTNAVVDEATVKSSGNDPLITIASDEFRKSKVDELEKQISKRQAPAVTQENNKTLKIEEEKPAPAAPKKLISSQSSAIKDIELESLKIKVSQLEKILSSRGLSAAPSTNAIPDEVKNTLQTQKEKIAQLESEKQSKVGELDQLQGKITELEDSLKKMSESLSQQQNTVAASTGDTDAKDKIISSLKKENAELLGKLNTLQLELDAKNKEVETLSAEIETSRVKITELETKILDTDTENAKLDQQIAEMEAKLTQIRQAPASNQGLANVGGNTESGGMSPWTWLIPALFLLSILAYLFKRSMSRSAEPALVAETPVQRQPQTEQRHDLKSATVTELRRDPEQKTTSNEPVTPAVTPTPVPDVIASASEEESLEASIKLDIAKAYIDMEMSDAAIEILQEAFDEGSQKQRVEAKHLLDKLAA